MSNRKVSRVVIANRKNFYGEWVVRAYDENGKRYPDADYHTDDRDDALQTAKAMVTD